MNSQCQIENRRQICVLGGKTPVSFGKGTFDDWCVYVERPNKLWVPKDYQYFSDLLILADVKAKELIYADFVAIFEGTRNFVDPSVLEQIRIISKTYGHMSWKAERVFTIIYAGMIAEENKEKAPLGKRIKRLGVHQVLIENISPDEAAHFSRDKKYAELNSLCRERGF